MRMHARCVFGCSLGRKGGPPHEISFNKVVDLCAQFNPGGPASDNDNMQQPAAFISRKAGKTGSLYVSNLQRYDRRTAVN